MLRPISVSTGDTRPEPGEQVGRATGVQQGPGTRPRAPPGHRACLARSAAVGPGEPAPSTAGWKGTGLFPSDPVFVGRVPARRKRPERSSPRPGCGGPLAGTCVYGVGLLPHASLGRSQGGWVTVGSARHLAAPGAALSSAWAWGSPALGAEVPRPAPGPPQPLPEPAGCWGPGRVRRPVSAAWSRKWSGWRRRGLKDNTGAF